MFAQSPFTTCIPIPIFRTVFEAYRTFFQNLLNVFSFMLLPSCGLYVVKIYLEIFSDNNIKGLGEEVLHAGDTLTPMNNSVNLLMASDLTMINLVAFLALALVPLLWVIPLLRLMILGKRSVIYEDGLSRKKMFQLRYVIAFYGTLAVLVGALYFVVPYVSPVLLILALFGLTAIIFYCSFRLIFVVPVYILKLPISFYEVWKSMSGQVARYACCLVMTLVPISLFTGLANLALSAGPGDLLTGYLSHAPFLSGIKEAVILMALATAFIDIVQIFVSFLPSVLALSLVAVIFRDNTNWEKLGATRGFEVLELPARSYAIKISP